MGQLLVRDLSERAVDSLKRRAARNGRSTEAEHRKILEDLASSEEDDFWREARKLREETRGRIKDDSTDIIRTSRDSGWTT